MPKTEEMTNFTFKMDRKTRNSYSKLCDEFGLSMSSATLALVRQAVRTQSMSFLCVMRMDLHMHRRQNYRNGSMK